MMIKVFQTVNEAKQKMLESGKVEHLVDVDWLMMSILGKSRPEYMMSQDELISDLQLAQFNTYMEKRLAGIPLQYVLKEQSFYGYDFYVDQRVLIPRFETEELVEKAVRIIKTNKYSHVLDMCTGSGCIGISLLLECENVHVDLVDLSEDALHVCSINAIKLKVDQRCERVRSNLFDEIASRKYDMIISNPPYIESSDIESLSIEVKTSEPRMALDGGEDGLDFYREIIEKGITHLNPGGYLLFEIGYNQMAMVIELMRIHGYESIEGFHDLAGHERMVIGRKKEV